MHAADYAAEDGGELTCYNRTGPASWTAEKGLEGIDAYLGENGIGLAGDDSFETPMGAFPLTAAYGHDPSFTTRMPYTYVDKTDYWDTDDGKWTDEYARGNSTTYNTHVRSNTKPTQQTESLAKPYYALAVFVDHNPTRRPGWGCAIFLHIEDGDDTWGCIAIEKPILQRIVGKWLDIGKKPYLSVIVDDPKRQSAE